MYNKIIMRLANSRLRRDFPRPPGEWRTRRHLWAPSAPIWETTAFGGGKRIKKKKNWGAGGAPVGPSAYAAFGSEKKYLGRLRRPKFRAPAANQMVLKT